MDFNISASNAHDELYFGDCEKLQALCWQSI